MVISNAGIIGEKKTYFRSIFAKFTCTNTENNESFRENKRQEAMPTSPFRIYTQMPKNVTAICFANIFAGYEILTDFREEIGFSRT